MPSRPDPAAAGSWLVIATSLPLAIGPAAATNLATYAGDQAAWALVAALSAAAALGSLLVRAVRPAPAAVHLGGIPAAFWAVLAVTAGVYVVLGAVTILEPLYVRQVLHGPFTLYGWLLAVWASSGAGVAVAAFRWPYIARWRWAIPLAVATLAAGVTLYISTASAAIAFAGATVGGAGAAWFRLSGRAVIVHAIPPHQHGRALSLWETVQCASSVAPTAAVSALVTTWGLRAVLTGCSALADAIAALSLASTAIRPPSTAGQLPDAPLSLEEPAGVGAGHPRALPPPGYPRRR